MANLRELRSRIRGINSIKKITKAQELIATSRISKAQARVAAAKPYSEEITKVVAELDLPALFAVHHAAGGATATMLLRDDPDPRRWGAIASDETGRVVGILDARSPHPPEGAVTERM